jgi:ABC-2 type transport system ATP-binding protein
LQLHSQKDREKAMEAVARLARQKPDFDEVTQTLRVPVKDGARTLMEVVRALDSAHVEPSSLSLHRPSLDDVFLALTGKRTEAEPAPETGGRRGKRRGGM